MNEIKIRPFEPGDQEAARALILAGLGERFQEMDSTLNLDLVNIWASYVSTGGRFLVAAANDRLVGTGGLVLETAERARIVRMSVAADQRRQGIARRIVQELISLGQRCGCSKIVVETNEDWFQAIALYKQCGFQPYDHRHGERHFELDLSKS